MESGLIRTASRLRSVLLPEKTFIFMLSLFVSLCLLGGPAGADGNTAQSSTPGYGQTPQRSGVVVPNRGGGYAGRPGQSASNGVTQSRYSPIAPDPRKNWYYNKQAAYAATPGFDPYRPGYSDNGSKSGLPARNPDYDHKYDHEARLRQLGNDPKVGRADRGWIRQEINRVDRNRSLPAKQRSGGDTLRMPPGKQLAHERGRENHKGYGFVYAQLQDADLHRLQHTGALDHRWDYRRDMNNPDVGGDLWGRRLKERVPDAYRNSAGSSASADQSGIRVFDASAGNQVGTSSLAGHP